MDKLRAIWAEMQNDALAAAGSSARVDHRSLAAQREEALEHASQARVAGQEQTAKRHEERAQVLMREPQKPRGISATIEAAGKALERKLRYQWARLYRKAERMARSAGFGGELFDLAARTDAFMRGHAHETPRHAHAPPAHVADGPWHGWEPEHGR